MTAPKLVWKEEDTDNGNHRWIAKSHHKLDYNWGIRPAIYNDKILFDFGNTAHGLMQDLGAGHRWQDGFPTLAESQAWCQDREDEAWAAANPVREFSDTEILDTCESQDAYFGKSPSGFTFWIGGSQVYRGNTRREAVTAYLRAHPPAKAAEHEPVPDREMTYSELANAFRDHRLYPRFDPDDRRGCWNVYQIENDEQFDFYGVNLGEVTTRCVAAIEAAKSKS